MQIYARGAPLGKKLFIFPRGEGQTYTLNNKTVNSPDKSLNHLNSDMTVRVRGAVPGPPQWSHKSLGPRPRRGRPGFPYLPKDLVRGKRRRGPPHTPPLASLILDTVCWIPAASVASRGGWPPFPGFNEPSPGGLALPGAGRPVYICEISPPSGWSSPLGFWGDAPFLRRLVYCPDLVWACLPQGEGYPPGEARGHVGGFAAPYPLAPGPWGLCGTHCT